MFGPPFGSTGGFGGMISGLGGLGDIPIAPRRCRPAGGMPAPFVGAPGPVPGFAIPAMPPMMRPPFHGMQDPFGVPGGIGQRFDPPRAARRQQGRVPQGQDRRRGGFGAPDSKYEKVKSLTPGGMSEAITIVRSRENGKLYVEKRVRTEGPHKKRTSAELNTLKAVKGHPNLNKMIEYAFKANGICSIILEYCDGGSLDERVAEQISRGGHFNESGVWHVLLSIAKALAYLHTGIVDVERDQGDPKWDTIAHLDIKPQNIFISSDNRENGQRRIVLADFGCAVSFTDIKMGIENERGQPYGTPGWYPPEGIAGAGYGTKTDIWMFGATIQVICLLMKVPHRPALASSKPCGYRYSQGLQNMVREITNRRFDKRPSARRIAVAAMQGLKTSQGR